MFHKAKIGISSTRLAHDRSFVLVPADLIGYTHPGLADDLLHGDFQRHPTPIEQELLRDILITNQLRLPLVACGWRIFPCQLSDLATRDNGDGLLGQGLDRCDCRLTVIFDPL